MSDTAQPGGDLAAPAVPVDVPTGAGFAPDLADNPAPPATADPNDPADDPGAAPTDKPDRPSRGVQKRIDELTADKHRYARDADYWRDIALQRQQSQQPAPAAPAGPQPLPPDLAQKVGTPPDPSKFPAGEFDPQYAVALAKHEMRLELASQEAAQRSHVTRQQQHQAAQQIGQRLDAVIQEGREKFADFDEAVNSLAVLQDPQRGNFVRAQVANMEAGADVAYYLAKNPKEAERVASARDAFAMARELGRIEGQLRVAAAPASQPTAAPNPPRTVRGGGAANQVTPYTASSMDDYAKSRGFLK